LLDMIDKNVSGKISDIIIEEEFLWKGSILKKRKQM
jgi:hypothetical protein